jgi:3-hydroxymyristoyl/3-hydroxydecanoyl-(acyl carrier protein) dehydratase
MTLELHDIEAILPHRPPLQLVQRAEIGAAGTEGTASIRLCPEELLWDDWRAADLADELLLESAAQLMGVVLATDPNRPAGAANAPRLLLGFDRIEFRKPVDPHRDIRIGVRIEARFGAMCRGVFEARQDGEPVAAGRISVMGG